MRHLRCVDCRTEMAIRFRLGNTNTYECPKCGLRICISPIETSKLKVPYKENVWIELTEDELIMLEDEKVIFT